MIPLPTSESPVPEKRLLMIAMLFPPDPMTGAARPGRFYKYLPRFGYRPIVVAARNAAVPDPNPEIHRVPAPEPDRWDRAIHRFGALVQRYLLPYNENLPWALLAVRHGQRICRAERPLAILSTAPPVGIHIAAGLLKLRNGLIWIADFRDPLLGNPFRGRRWIFPFDRLLEAWIFRHASVVIANTEDLAGLWRARYPQWTGKIQVIWNGFDPEQAVMTQPLPVRARRILSHVGSLYAGRHPFQLLASLDRLIAAGRIDPATFTVRLVGYMEPATLEKCRSVYSSLADRGCLEADGRLVSPEQATEAAASSEYLLLLDVNERNASLQVPGKVFEYVRIGRPILTFTSPGSPTERILSQSGIPFRGIDPAAPDHDTDEKVCEFLQLPCEARAPSEWFERTFNGIEQTRQLAERLRECEKNGG
jgi:hypothetical protein